MLGDGPSFGVLGGGVIIGCVRGRGHHLVLGGGAIIGCVGGGVIIGCVRGRGHDWVC